MNNNKKFNIGSCVIGLVLVLVLLAANVGMKLKYDTKSRSTVELVKTINLRNLQNLALK